MGSIRVFKWVKSCTELFIGYPRFSSDYIDQHIRGARTEPSELNEYIGLGRDGYIRLFMIIYSAFNFFRMVAYPSIMNLEVDLVNIEENLEEFAFQENGSKLLRFSCLVTNCSRPTDLPLVADGPRPLIDPTWFEPDMPAHMTPSERLAHQFRRLPFFPICHPIAAMISEINMVLDCGGMFLGSMGAIFLLLPGVIFPIIQILKPINDLFCASITAPRVTRRVVRDRARQLKMDLTLSLANYHSRMVQRHLEWLDEYQQQQRGALAVANEGRATMRDKHYSPYLNQDSTSSLSMDQDKLARFTNDCMPLVRSRWWRRTISNSFQSFAIIHVVILYSVPLFIVLLVATLVSQRSEYVARVVRQMRRDGCSIWSQADNATLTRLLQRPTRVTDADFQSYYVFDLNPLRVLNFVIQWSPIQFLVMVLLLIYGGLSDLFLWIHEIEFQLTICIELSKQLKLANKSARFRAHDSVDEFNMGILRREFKSLVDVISTVVVVSPFESSDLRGQRRTKFPAGNPWALRVFYPEHSKFKSTIDTELFVLRLVQANRLSRRALIDLLEKSLINYRIFVEHLLAYSPPIAIFILCIVFINNCTVATAIVYVKMIKGFTFWPIVSMAFLGFFTSILIFVASSFHARLRNMQPLIWSLVAETCDSEDLQIEHLRVLWLKQAERSAVNGGLAINVFGIRITYINIFQLVIWVSTIVGVVVRF